MVYNIFGTGMDEDEKRMNKISERNRCRIPMKIKEESKRQKRIEQNSAHAQSDE